MQDYGDHIEGDSHAYAVRMLSRGILVDRAVDTSSAGQVQLVSIRDILQLLGG